MKNEINELIKKYSRIKKEGYIKSHVPYKNGAGITLENLLGSSGADFCIPDYNGIEIKAIRDYPYAEFDLVNISPDGSHYYPSQWIANNFGYPDKDFKDIKIFKGNINAVRLTKIGLFYYFKLRIDRTLKKVFIQVFNYNKEFINEDIYWDFDSIEKKLNQKLNYLALFNVKKLYSNNSYYYFYEKMNIYTLNNFEYFLNSLENGKIFVTFKTGVFKSGKYIGHFQDHGTAFRITKNNIESLFKKIY